MTDIDKMRAIADFLEAHPDMPTVIASTGRWLYDKDEAIKVAKLPGAKKEYGDSYLTIKVPVVDEVTLYYFISREKVCTPTETVKEWVEPQEGRYDTKVVAWKCHPLLAPTPEGEAIEAMLEGATPAAKDEVLPNV